MKKSKPIKVDEVIQLYKEQLNRHDSEKDFFTKEEIHLLIEHEESLRAKIMELEAENARLKEKLDKYIVVEQILNKAIPEFLAENFIIKP